MINSTNDVFTAPELYLMASSFEGNFIFGLPDKEIYQLRKDDSFKNAFERLIEKNILSENGELTSGGYIAIKSLEYYHQSKKYVRINNMMFSFRNDEEDELIVLIELESEQYKLMVLSKAFVLKGLSELFPIILREPTEEEKDFLTRPLLNSERHDVDEYVPNQLVNLEVFELKEGIVSSDNSKTYQQWIVFEKEEMLIMINTVEKRYYQVSQYWFLKMLFDELEFPYQEAN